LIKEQHLTFRKGEVTHLDPNDYESAPGNTCECLLWLAGSIGERNTIGQNLPLPIPANVWHATDPGKCIDCCTCVKFGPVKKP
jgi:hypothetical protein